MWKIKFLWHFVLALISLLRNYDQRQWLRFRENGNSARWRIEGKKYDLAYRREQAGNPMTKAHAQQWEMHKAFQAKTDEELDENLVLCAVNLVTWIALLRMNDKIETEEDRKAADEENEGKE